MRLATRHISYFERQMPQATSFRIRRARRRIGKGEQFQLRSIRQGQIELVRIAMLAEMLGQHAQAERFRVEPFGDGVICANDCNVVDALEHQCPLPSIRSSSMPCLRNTRVAHTA